MAFPSPSVISTSEYPESICSKISFTLPVACSDWFNTTILYDKYSSAFANISC